MELALALGFFLLLAGVISAWGYRLYVKPARFRDRLGEAVITEGPVLDRPAVAPAAVRIIQRIGEKAPISPQDTNIARRLLIAAGHRSDTAVKVYYGAKFVLGIALLLLAFVLRTYIENPILRIVIIPAFAAGGFYLPNFFVEKLVDRRRLALRHALPDALDLMVVCMEAGLGLDQAIANVSRELKATHPEICEEFGLVTLEMRAGKRRGDALKNLADRTAEPELRKLVATMIQADRFGTSVAESLRTHSDFMRVRRRQDAEERAGKVGVKLVFPIFFFILPSMLVVAAGPGILQVVKGLFPIMKGFGQ